MVQLIMSLLLYQQFPANSIHYSNYNRIIDNWKIDLITDLEIIPAASNCSSGYDVLLTYQFPGTQEGCDCTGAIIQSNNQQLQKIVYKGMCSNF